MKVMDGKPFEIRTERCIATVVVENFSQRHVEEFNRLLVDAAIKRFENQELRRA